MRDKVKLRNHEKEVRILKEGANFGEVAVIFKGRRSATVRTRNFTTLGVIHAEEARSIFEKYPEYQQILLDKIYSFHDPLTLFFQKILNTVDFIRGVSNDVMHEIIYSLTP